MLAALLSSVLVCSTGLADELPFVRSVEQPRSAPDSAPTQGERAWWDRPASNGTNPTRTDETSELPEWAVGSQSTAQLGAVGRPDTVAQPTVNDTADSRVTGDKESIAGFLPPIRASQRPDAGGVYNTRHLQSPEVGPLSPPVPRADDYRVPPPIFDDVHDYHRAPSRFYSGQAPELSPPQFADDHRFAEGPISQPMQPTPFVVPYQTRLIATWLAGAGNSLGISDLDLSSVLAFPEIEGFAITPGIQAHWLNGPSRTDLPGQLYNVRAEFALKRPWNERWSYLVSLAPGVYSDFDTGDSDAIRVIGRALGFYKLSPTADAMFGVIYVDRENIAALPAGGVILTPNPDSRLELLFPKPKLSRRVAWSSGREWWAYISGEFGGGSWAVERRGGADDVVTLSDLRLIFGLEAKFPGAKTVSQNVPLVFFEAGYVFNREVEFESGMGDFNPDDTAMLRAGVVY